MVQNEHFHSKGKNGRIVKEGSNQSNTDRRESIKSCSSMSRDLGHRVSWKEPLWVEHLCPPGFAVCNPHASHLGWLYMFPATLLSAHFTPIVDNIFSFSSCGNNCVSLNDTLSWTSFAKLHRFSCLYSEQGQSTDYSSYFAGVWHQWPLVCYATKLCFSSEISWEDFTIHISISNLVFWAPTILDQTFCL